MINKTENKNGFPQQNAQLRFPKVNAALDINKIVKKPFVKNSKQAFPETFNIKKPSFNRLLGLLSASDLSRLRPHLEPITLSLGESIYQPQERISYVYFPESAVISDLQMLEDGRTVEIAMTGKEGVTGLSSVLNSRAAVNWTEVVAAGSALKLDAQILRQEFACNSSLQTTLFNYVNSYIEQISQRIICNNYHQLKKRFCSRLLMLQKRNGGNKFSLTHEQMARFLGVHRPSISHIASELRDGGTIDYRRGHIIIVDDRKLENSTCSCVYSI